jgi:hypothetical protein
MRLFNLTDKALPRKSAAEPQTLRKAGIVIEPGGFVDTPKNFMLGTVGGWITSGKVAVDQPPAWYLEAKPPEPKAEEPVVKEAPEPEPEEKKVEVDVGAMTVTVEPGEDGELGTDDDEVDITPKKRSRKKAKKGGKK